MAAAVIPPPPEGFVLTGADARIPPPPAGFEIQGAPAKARDASGPLEALQAGYQGSATGLAIRGKLPDVVLDAQHAKWYEKALASVGQMVSEVPEMVVGAVGGGVAGAAGGTAVAPGIGTAIGGVLGSGAGAFAVPAAIRTSLMEAYKSGTVDSSGGFLNSAKIVLEQTGKEGLIGALTFGAGGVAARVVGKAIAPAIGEAVSVGTARTAIGAAQATAEVGAMVVAPAALEGRLPEPEDFLNAAIVVFGAKGAIAGAGKLRSIYAKTGVRPEQVVADAKNDPALAQELTAEPVAEPTVRPEFNVEQMQAKLAEKHPAMDVVPMERHPNGVVEVVDFGLREGEPQAKGAGSAAMQEVTSQADASGTPLFLMAQPNRGSTMSLEKLVEFYERHGFKREAEQPYEDSVYMYREPQGAANAGESANRSAGTPGSSAALPRAAQADSVPSTYAELARQETARAIVPGVKAEDVAKRPFADSLPQVPGEPAKPTHVNYNRINTSEDTKLALARISEVYEAEIQGQRRGAVSWAETSAEAGKQLSDVLGGVDTKLIQPREPGTPAGAAEILARKQMVVGAAEAMMAARDDLLAKGVNASAQDKLTFLAAIERTSMIQAEFLGARAEAGRALNILKSTAWDARRAEQIQGVIEAFSEGKPEPKVFNEKAPFAENTIFTAEKVAAAREFLKSKIGTLHSGLDPEMLQAGLTIAGGYVEAGLRDFARFSKAMVSDLGDGIKPYLKQFYDGAMEQDKARAAERVKDADVLEATQMHGDPMKLAEMMKQIDNPASALKFARDAVKATTWEKVVEAWKAGILSGPVTHLANVIGNTTFMAMRPVIDLTAAAIGKLSGASDRVAAVEPMARVFGNLQGAKDALTYAGALMRTAYEEGGVKGLAKEIAVGTDVGPQKAEVFRNAISGVKGDVIRLPFRGLQVADAFFKTMNERGEAYTLATRQAVKEGLNIQTREFRERVVELVQNPPAEMAAQVEAAGLRFTFNTPSGEVGKAVSDLVRKAHLQMFVPFVRTPGNILKELVRMTPAAPLVGEWRAAIKSGGAEQAKAIAELGMGSAIMGVVASYALDGSITGQGSPDAGKKRVAAAAGEQPYSFKLGDTYYNYQRLQPVGTLIGMAADMAKIWDHMTEEEMDKVPKMVATAFANAVTNQTFLQGVTSIVNAMSDPKRFGPRMAQQMAGSVVPAIVAQPTIMADPYVREVNSILDAIRSRIPGQREQLMAKRDVFGEQVQTKERLGAFSPVTETTESKDPVRLEALRLGVSTGDAPKQIHLGRGSGKIGNVEITPEQRNAFTEISGHLAHDILEPIVTSPTWDALPDLVKKRIYQRAFTAGHRNAAISVFPAGQREALVGQISQKIEHELQPAE